MVFKVGDNVLLDEGMFIPTEEYPCKNSYFEIPGVVLSVNKEDNKVKLRWNNGSEHIFDRHYLCLIDKTKEEIYINTTLAALKPYLAGLIPEHSEAINKAKFTDLPQICNVRIYLAPWGSLDDLDSQVKLIININQLVPHNSGCKSIW